MAGSAIEQSAAPKGARAAHPREARSDGTECDRRRLSISALKRMLSIIGVGRGPGVGVGVGVTHLQAALDAVRVKSWLAGL